MLERELDKNALWHATAGPSDLAQAADGLGFVSGTSHRLYPPDVLARAVEFLASNQDRFPFSELLSHDYQLEDIDKAFTDSDAIGGKSCKDVSRASIVMGAA